MITFFQTGPEELLQNVLKYCDIGMLGKLEAVCKEYRKRILYLWEKCAKSLNIEGSDLKMRTLTFLANLKDSFHSFTIDQFPKNFPLQIINCSISENTFQDIQYLKNASISFGCDILSVWRKFLNNYDFTVAGGKPLLQEINSSFKDWFQTNRRFQNTTKILDISRLQMKSIPSEVLNLSNLILLNLEKNHLKRIPYDIARLAKLTTLILNSNLIESLKEICKLTNLKILQAKDNLIKYIPFEIKNLQKLQVLDLESNSIKEIPPEIQDLKKIKTMNLGQNLIEETPNEIGNLKSLHVLDLSKNYIEKTPKIENLINLKCLALQGNQISEIPNNIKFLKKLEVLNLAGNQLEKLPNEFSKLKKLTSLALNENKFKSIEILEKNLPVNLQEISYKDNPFNQEPPLKKARNL